MIPFVAPPRGRGFGLSLRLALRELRAGFGGFRVFLACLALGVAAIGGVGSVATSLSDALTREGRTILGGDVAFSLIHREANAEERAFLQGQGAVAVAATTRAMARTAAGGATLVELKAVDGAYPLVGVVETDPPAGFQADLAERDGRFGAVADPALLARLGVGVGDPLTVGSATLEIRAKLVKEPDALSGGLGFGPRLFISEAALRATGLIQPGSLMRWSYRVALPGGASADPQPLVEAAKARFPDAGWQVRTRDKASAQLARNAEQFTQYLTFVGLTALLVGGVGVANAVGAYVARKRESIATLKCLGASGGRVVAIYLAQILMIALAGITAGLVVAALIPYVAAAALGQLSPIPVAASFAPGQLLLAAAYGILVALTFTLWPLGRAHDVPVSALFREHVSDARRWPRPRYAVLSLVGLAALVALAVFAANDRRIALLFVAGAAGVFLLLRLVALAVMAIAARLPRPRATELRLALANVHRPGALTPSVVLSLGLGLALLVAITLIDVSIRRQLTEQLPAEAPSFFFVDIPNSDAGAFADWIHAEAPQGKYEAVPMLRGRITALKGIPSEDYHPAAEAAWVLNGDRGITHSDSQPKGSRLVEGEWWPAGYDGKPLVSFEVELARLLDLHVGDTIKVNVLGREIQATIANLRTVDWERLNINFVMIFSSNTFRGAPYQYLATLTYPDGGTEATELSLLRATAARFPSITIMRVKDALAAVDDLVRTLALAIRAASAVTLIASVFVLAGALAAGHRHRLYDAVILKTLGATRRRVLGAFVLEYLALGVATALFGVAAGALAAWAVTARVMKIGFAFDPAGAGLAAFGALAVTIALGLAGTWRILGAKPAAALRDL